MSAALITTALVIALASVPTIAALTAWGLAGGDGEPKNVFLGVLGAIVGFGSIYTALTCFAAFWGLSDWRWWLTLLPPAAGLLGLLLSGDEPEDTTASDRLIGLAMQVGLGIPAVLLLASGAVTL